MSKRNLIECRMITERKIRYATIALLDMVDGDVAQVLDVVELAHYHWTVLREASA